MLPPILLPGLPPFGRGGYARDSLEPYLASFVALNAWRSDVAAQAVQARARGLDVWLYGTPEHWRPDTWETSLARIVAQCRALGCVGVIADAEGDWGGQVSQARALGRALKVAAAHVRVGFTSFPAWPHVRALANECRGSVWGTPQLYGRTARGADVFAAWIAPWNAAFGSGRVIISIAGWASATELATPAGYTAYLASLPPSAGCLAWDESGNAPAYIVGALQAFTPKSMIPKAVEALSVQPVVIAVLTLAALMLAAATVKVK